MCWVKGNSDPWAEILRYGNVVLPQMRRHHENTIYDKSESQLTADVVLLKKGLVVGLKAFHIWNLVAFGV